MTFGEMNTTQGAQGKKRTEICGPGLCAGIRTDDGYLEWLQDKRKI